MRKTAFLLIPAMLFATAVFAQTTSVRTSTRVFDLQKSLSPVSLGSNTQYVSGAGIRLVAAATSGTALYSGVNAPFATNNVVPSWNLDVPDGTGYRIEVRAVNGGTSTIWYEVFRQGYIPGGITRYRSDGNGYIDWDTLKLYSTWPRIEYRVTLYTSRLGATPTLRLMALCYADMNYIIAYVALPPPGTTTSLPVPWRSQYWVPGIGGEICGPTSLAMAEEYFGCNLPSETVAADCYDVYYDGYGNWPLLAQAASKRGFQGYVFRANTQQPLRDHFAAGNLVIVSMAYDEGDLTNSPIPSTDGHLVLIVGVTADGDYLANDSAGSDSRWDHVVYDAYEMAHVWLYIGDGTGIVIMPNLVYGRYAYYTYQSTSPVATDTSGRINLFAPGGDGNMYALRQSVINGGWDAWSSLGGMSTSGPVTATNRLKGNTTFARFADGIIYFRMQSPPGGPWTDWASIGGQGVGKPAVGKSPDGRLDVFSRASDGTIWHSWEAAGAGWQAWTSLGGFMAGDPAVALTWEGREEVYARGIDNQLYWCYQLNDGSWSAWSSLGGPIAGQPAVGRASNGRTEVYCRFEDGSIRYRRQSSLDVGTAWTAWTYIAASAGSDPVLARPQSGLQEIFYTDTSGQVLRCRQTSADGAYGGWESLGGSATGAPIVGHHDDGRLQVFIVQADGRMWGRTQINSSTWGNWTAIGSPLFADQNAPTINSVYVSPPLVAAGDAVRVDVNASDNLAVQAVTANGTALTKGTAGNWSGTIAADSASGVHPVLVQARDAANNVTSDSGCSYTTAPVYSIANRSVFDEIMLDAQSKFLFCVWGRVSEPTTGGFIVNDGSNKPVRVYAANHGLTAGRYVIVRGVLSPTEGSIISSAEFIQAKD